MKKHRNEQTPLSEGELALWHAFKRVSENALSLVAGDIEAATGLSGADFGILTRLEDLGAGSLLQHELAKSLGWSKSRLSHQLTRMESRGLLGRKDAKVGRGVLVSISARGRKAVATARPAHAAAVRAHVLSRVRPGEARVLLEVFQRIG